MSSEQGQDEFAPDVTAPVPNLAQGQHLVGQDESTPDVAATADLPLLQHLVQCDFAADPCVIASALGEKAATSEHLSDWMPCSHCRRPAWNAERLIGVRLGRTERALLLESPEPDADGMVVAVASRSQTVARQRAAVKLWNIGLLKRWTSTSKRPHRQRWRDDPALWDRWSVHVRRSPFGHEVIRVYRKELETGERIRWDDRRFEAARAATLPVDRLVGRFAESVKGSVERVKSVFGYERMGLSLCAPQHSASVRASVERHGREILAGEEALQVLTPGAAGEETARRQPEEVVNVHT